MAKATTDLKAVFKTKEYTALLIVSAILGVPIAIFAYFFLFITDRLQHLTYVTIPNSFIDSTVLHRWWPVIPLALSGLIVGLIVKYFPGKGGEEPIEGFSAGGGPVKPEFIAGIALAAIASIGLGAIVGPEAPLVALGGGLAYAMLSLRKKNLNDQASKLIGASGSFAAISTLLGSPLTAAFLLMEASGAGGLALEIALLPGLLAAGIGYLIFVGLDSLTGLGLFSLTIPDLPTMGNPTGKEFIWAIIIGFLAPFLIWAIRQAARYSSVYIRKNIVVMTVAAGAVVGILAVFFTIITKQDANLVLFSGQNQLPALINGAAGFTVGTLLLLILIKGLGYALSLVAFRGGPTFPAMFIGAAIGVLVSNAFGINMLAAVAVGIGAMTAGMLRLPLTAVLLTTIFLGKSGINAIPLVIVAVVISYVMTQRLQVNE